MGNNTPTNNTKHINDNPHKVVWMISTCFMVRCDVGSKASMDYAP